MKRYQKTTISQYAVLALFVLCIIAIGYLSFFMMQKITFEDHFAVPWAAGRLWLYEGVNPYDSAVLEFAQSAIDGSPFLTVLPATAELVDPMINLVFYLLLSLLPFTISRVIWVTILVVVAGSLGYLSIRLVNWQLSIYEKIGVVILVMVWLPSIYSAFSGRLSLFIILFVIGSVHLFLKGQDTAAGLLLSLSFGSYPTSLLIIILFLAWGISRRRWEILTAYFSGLAFLIIIFSLMLPTWPLNWIAVMLDNFQGWAWIDTPLMTLAGFLPGIENFLLIFLHGLCLIYFIIQLLSILGKSGLVFVWKISAILLIAYLLHVNGNIQHLFLILPAMFLVFRFWSERWQVIGRLVSWAVLLFVFIAPWVFLQPGKNIAELSVPALFLVGFPLIVFAGLIWVRWWALKIPKPYYDT